ncbi:MAG: putative entry exclusion protein TrbK-alt [Aquamicrobium sp.]|uniref:putative entry exclusion protein TrbK-alt n=1 Tax=Mesorhizobium sp. Pch-S TaxID=2082387 RepID=UPI0010135228|nr:putative entry exclusion protein TrbK-alt [Mesorhizobium sp. Pch-S]MBR2686267.1 putative entry exclusion protein TrbK-alt [Aquamicrobium sp.]QAZ44124.1 conjugal transfer protein TrbK [Mesorhizobium sp. Pch-S]
MDARMLARLAAVLALVATAAAAALVHKQEAPPSLVARPFQADWQALRERQRRCQQLGEAGALDAACLQAWAETRDRFLRSAPNAHLSGQEQ